MYNMLFLSTVVRYNKFVFKRLDATGCSRLGYDALSFGVDFSLQVYRRLKIFPILSHMIVNLSALDALLLAAC